MSPKASGVCQCHVGMHYEKTTTISGFRSASENEDVAQCRPD